MGRTIVCIDDERALCRVLQFVLQETGATVVTFTDPVAGLSYLNAHAHDVALVFCDYRMPNMTGLELLAQLTTPAPFVLISGDIDVAELAVAVPGVSAVLSKPFTPEQIVGCARRFLDG